ncbi:muts domain V-domain-containing protein [Limtongia smithiae]|uniref:muts domain V-domain-containing protein n=1 Tax=Limtongia smithiae TaxID=1125753 RepID=UPI0034CD7B06
MSAQQRLNGTQQSISRFFQSKGAADAVPQPRTTIATTREEQHDGRKRSAESTFGQENSNVANQTAGLAGRGALKRFERGAESKNNSDDQAPEKASKRRKPETADCAALNTRKNISRLNLSEKTSDEIADEEGGEDPAESQEEGADETTEVSDRFAQFAAKSTTAKRGSSRSASATTGKKLTPLEQQYIRIKAENLDTVLAVKVGYKYHFYGEDARIASSVLHIYLVPGWRTIEEATSGNKTYSRFASSSVPEHRIFVHIERLIDKGYKVGIVSQTETAALKAAGANKGGLFERKLTQVYTKGTYVDRSSDVEGMSGSGLAGGFIFSITETQSNSQGATIGVLALSASTGQVLYEELLDGFMRSELETRLLHIQPCEIVIVGTLSRESEKILSHVSSGAQSSGVRVERISKPDLNEARNHLTEHYGNKLCASQGDDATANSDLLDRALSLPPSVMICLSATMTYMKQYGLESLFELTTGFEDFKNKGRMLLNGNTLTSLEIYQNQTDFTSKGSLFWIMDQTKTRFGQRLFRKWVGSPLVDREQLEYRIAAVEEIKNSRDPRLEKVCFVMSKLPDLENSLMKIHYGRCKQSELLTILRAFDRICTAFSEFDNSKQFMSGDLNEYFGRLPKMRREISASLAAINQDAAAKNDIESFFKDDELYPDILDRRVAIATVECELEGFIADARKTLNKSYIKYSTVGQHEFLIELRNTELRNVPKTWLKMSGTKTVSRFHPPEVQALLKEREQHRESLTLACEEAYKSFLATIAAKYEELRGIVQALATLDCLISLAAISMMPNYVKPTYIDEPCIKITEGRHPMIEHLLLNAFVPNDILISANDTRTLIITGPNMGGKSSYVRQTALIAIMGQIGSYVPAQAATLGMLDAVYTRMGAYDNMMAGESTFMVELHECSDIMKMATSRSLVLLDEIGRGTGPIDGVAIAHAVLSHFITDIKALTLFITHYPLLCSFADRYPAQVSNYYMGYLENHNEQTQETDIAFLYKAIRGIAHRSYGLNVARLADLPRSIIDSAAEKSKELENTLTTRQAVSWALKARDLMIRDQPDTDELYDLADFI